MDIRQRSQEEEIMDDFALAGETLREALDEIARINRWLGGNQITLSGVRQLLREQSFDRPVRIWDLGCGGGDMLRQLAKWGRRQQMAFELTGIDANADAIAYARELSKDFPEISYVHAILPDDSLDTRSVDIVLCTLFLHHFSEAAILDMLQRYSSKATTGLVINDLQRSALAYFLFGLITLFHRNKMTREDGLTSIKRGFRRFELEVWATKLKRRTSQIRWRWAFRYQWIIQPQQAD